MATVFDPLRDPAIERAVATFCGDIQGLCGTIDRRDEMFLYNRDQLYGSEACAATLYFLQGWQIASAVRDLADQAFGGMNRVESFLDFASGFGRASRFMVRELPPERMWISDIVPAAVAFQEQHFGVHGVLSTTDPGALHLDHRFDYIFVSSLFSHLPAATFGRWLERLLALLEPGGLLAISVLDEGLFGGRSEARADMVFHPESESNVLPGDQYGTAYVTEAFVRERIGDVTRDARATRIAAGLCGHQDLYLIAPDPSSLRQPLSELQPRRYPRGELDRFDRIGPSAVEISGWVTGIDSVTEVFLWSAGHRWPALISTTDDPKTRWQARIDLERIGLDELVLIVARGKAGVEAPFALGTLRPFLA